MNQGELTKELRENAVLNLYQNGGYQTERVQRKSMILDIQQTSSGDDITNFTINLQEPLIIDKLSDMYLESLTTVNCQQGAKASTGRIGFILKFDQFNINTAAGSTVDSEGSKIFNSVFIPNNSKKGEQENSVVLHQENQLNYICDVNPTKLFTISGSITDFDGGVIINSGEDGRIVIKLVFISRY
tara:strand:- start:2826 stop:3383 length:558 start_codon:yes stop_codon:yes gene_type:complete